jgi:hypothetical protein
MVLGIQNLFHVGGFLMVLFTTSRENVCQWLIPLGYSIHHHVIQFVSSMSQVDISLWVFHTTSRENICQWLIPLGYSIQHHVIQFVSDLFPWGTLFNNMWYSLSVPCLRSIYPSEYFILHHVIKIVRHLFNVIGFFMEFHTTSRVSYLCLSGRWILQMKLFKQKKNQVWIVW